MLQLFLSMRFFCKHRKSTYTLLPNSIFNTKKKKNLITLHLDHLYHMLGNSVMLFPELFQGAHVSIQIEKYV